LEQDSSCDEMSDDRKKGTAAPNTSEDYEGLYWSRSSV
jgi:hypothetical protein